MREKTFPIQCFQFSISLIWEVANGGLGMCEELENSGKKSEPTNVPDTSGVLSGKWVELKGGGLM